MHEGKKEPGDLAKDPTGFAVLAVLLPELLRRAKDVDCVCGNCANWMCAWEARELTSRAACEKLPPAGSLLFTPDGPPWRECRLFAPSEEFKKCTVSRRTLGDLLAEVERKSEGKRP